MKGSSSCLSAIVVHRKNLEEEKRFRGREVLWLLTGSREESGYVTDAHSIRLKFTQTEYKQNIRAVGCFGDLIRSLV